MNSKLFFLIHNERPYKRYYGQPLSKDTSFHRMITEVKTYVTLPINALRLPLNKKYNIPQFEGPRKSTLKMMMEHLKWALKYKELCNYYWVYGLDQKGHSPNDYMAYTEFRVMRNILNIRQRENVKTKYTFNYLSLVRDKFVFYQYCKSLGIPFPKTIALVSNGKVSWYDGEHMIWSDLQTVVDRNFRAFCKETTGEGGQGAFVLESKDGVISISGTPATIDELRKRVGMSTYIMQEQIKNHHLLSEIYPNSLNTLRLHTILNRDGSVDFFSAVQRFGAHGSIVDNGCYGGMFVGVNEKGVLNEFGCHEPHLGYKKMVIRDNHPDTGKRFSSIQLPYWDEIMETAKTFHKFLYGIPSIGWDIAITEDGFCFTEAGEDWEMAFDQAVNGGQRERFYKTHGYALNIKLRKL